MSLDIILQSVVIGFFRPLDGMNALYLVETCRERVGGRRTSRSAFRGPFTTREYEVKLVVTILPFLPSFKRGNRPESRQRCLELFVCHVKWLGDPASQLDFTS